MEDERPSEDIIENDFELDRHIDDVMKQREKKKFDESFNRKNSEL